VRCKRWQAMSTLFSSSTSRNKLLKLIFCSHLFLSTKKCPIHAQPYPATTPRGSSLVCLSRTCKQAHASILFLTDLSFNYKVLTDEETLVFNRTAYLATVAVIATATKDKLPSRCKIRVPARSDSVRSRIMHPKVLSIPVRQITISFLMERNVVAFKYIRQQSSFRMTHLSSCAGLGRRNRIQKSLKSHDFPLYFWSLWKTKRRSKAGGVGKQTSRWFNKPRSWVIWDTLV